MMNWIYVSVASQITLLIYLQIHEWIHLPAWNGRPSNHSQRRVDLVLGLVQAGLIAGVIAEWVPAITLAVAVYAGWLALQVLGWWVPYVRGASEDHMRYYAQHWAGTWRFLPPIADHPIPNAAHVILQALIIASLGSTAAELAGATP